MSDETGESAGLTCACGHAKRSHKYANANASGRYTFYSSCRIHDCECPDYRPGEVGGDSQ